MGGIMSESLFLNQHIREFASSHPHESGWKVYEFPGEAVRRMAFPYLLDFIQWHHPECLKGRIAMKCVSEEELKTPPDVADIEVPHKEVERGRELKSDSWFGHVDIEWAGYSIHFKSFLVKAQGGYTTVYHAATQSNIALCLLLQALERYGKTRQKSDARHITVMNGPDIPISPIEWDDIILPHGFLDAIRRNVTSFFESGERYRTLPIPHRRGLLFAGPPGCGKTVTLKALAHHTRVKFITLLGKANIDDSDIENMMELAAQCSPAIVLLEDLDKLLEAKDVSLSYFLNLLDGLNVLKGILLIATCNEPEKLDPALLHRPSRFDRVWTFPLPAMEQRLALLRRRGQGHFSDSALEEAAEKSHGFSMAYVQEIVVNALLESVHSGTAPSDADLLRSLETLRSQRKTIIKKLDSLVEPESVGFALPNGG
jgi:hypothetical protein